MPGTWAHLASQRVQRRADAAQSVAPVHFRRGQPNVEATSQPRWYRATAIAPNTSTMAADQISDRTMK